MWWDKLNNIKGNLITLLFLIALKAVFDYLYFTYVSQYFRTDLFYLDYSYEKHIYSFLLLIMLGIFTITLLNQPKKPSRVIILLLFLSIIVPMLTLYAFTDAPSQFVLVLSACYILLILQIKYLPNLKFKILHRSVVRVLIFSIILIYLYVYGFLIATGGLSRLNFDLKEVYDVRRELALLTNKGPFLGYFISWVANVFNMGIITWGLYKKEKKIIILGIILQLIIFGITNFKSFLFAPILVIFLYKFTQKRNLLLYSIISVITLLMISYFSFLYTNDHQWASILIRRQFFSPSNIHLIYYDFFKNDYNPFIYLSNSIFKYFVNYPYTISVPRIISWEYWGSDFGPNVGYLGEAYSQFGFIGMLLFSIILGFMLKILDSFTEVLPYNLISALIALPAFSLVNSSLFTTMLTHGFLISLLTLLIMGNFVKGR